MPRFEHRVCNEAIAFWRGVDAVRRELQAVWGRLDCVACRIHDRVEWNEDRVGEVCRLARHQAIVAADVAEAAVEDAAEVAEEPTEEPAEEPVEDVCVLPPLPLFEPTSREDAREDFCFRSSKVSPTRADSLTLGAFSLIKRILSLSKDILPSLYLVLSAPS